MTPSRRKANDRLRVAGYARVSTDEQRERGVSLAAQKERIEAQCLARNWLLLRTYTDVASGKDLKRDSLTKLLKDAEAGEIEAVVITKLDRLSRRMLDFAQVQVNLQQRNIALVSITEGFDDTTPVGRAMANVIMTFAQMERELIGERTRDALAYKRKHLQVYGSTPYGFTRKADHLLPNGKQLAIVQEIFKRRRAVTVRPPGRPGTKPPGESLREIAKALTKRSIPSPQGRPEWSAETVRLILRNAPLYGQVMNGLL